MCCGFSHGVGEGEDRTGVSRTRDWGVGGDVRAQERPTSGLSMAMRRVCRGRQRAASTREG